MKAITSGDENQVLWNYLKLLGFLNPRRPDCRRKACGEDVRLRRPFGGAGAASMKQEPNGSEQDSSWTQTRNLRPEGGNPRPLGRGGSQLVNEFPYGRRRREGALRCNNRQRAEDQ